jgi:diguanylate cyclase (GGDEF)-like protein
MTFRTRLTTFFLMIVIVPMIGVGVVVFRLISDSRGAKADARAAGLASVAQSLYAAQSNASRSEAAALARDHALLSASNLQHRLRALLASSGLARIRVTNGSRVLADVGAGNAVAPGSAVVLKGPGAGETVTVSNLTATQYARSLSSPGVGVVLREGGTLLYASPAGTGKLALAGRQTISVDKTSYRAVTESLPGIGGRLAVTVLSDEAYTSGAIGTSRALAIGFIGGFLLLAFAFSVLASRALEGQLRRFLQAARRLASGDFSAPVHVEGEDDFALLGQEFNNMALQLQSRLDDLGRERERLRESISRIGKTFEANLDRPALLELALRTAMDAVGAEGGRLSVRPTATEPLSEQMRVGSLGPAGEQVITAERTALASRDLGLVTDEDTSTVAVTLAPVEQDGPAEGVLTVVRRERSFDEAECDLLRSLASQASLALENVRLHEQVSRQAVTDELTGLANHGRFQELLALELEQVRRYHHPVGLIMIDIDDFKQVNDTYGHQQGDLVLKEVARILRASSRDADVPARYGGEELAVILPHTGTEGAYAIAERIRREIARLKIPRLDGGGQLKVTASLGVAATSSGVKNELIGEADTALYAAKRTGKNRTTSAATLAANVVGEG